MELQNIIDYFFEYWNIINGKIELKDILITSSLFTTTASFTKIPTPRNKSNKQHMQPFCFLIGILFVYTSSYYLPLISFLLFFIRPKIPTLLFFLLGFFYALLHQWIIEPRGFPAVEVLTNVKIRGEIASIPIQTPYKKQFIFKVDRLEDQKVQGLVQLSWYNKAPVLHAGETWEFRVKLKRPRNFQNPGSSDFKQSLATRHIQWTGYIGNKEAKRLAKPKSTWSILKLREYLATTLTKRAPDEKTAGILEALSLNITTHVTQEEWELFRRTGTVHLFGISGEHIALVSGLVFWLTRKLWSRSASCCLAIPAPIMASLAGLLVAILYAFLAGFAPPVQRALIGCFFYTLACIGKQKLSPWQIWRYALFGVLCLEPHAALMQGFYFSFLAVACLLLTQKRWQLKGIKAKLALQLSCLIGLMPLTLYWFSYGSINGFLANMFAIPLVGLGIVPLTLIMLLVCSFDWSIWLIQVLTWLITFLFQGLEWTAWLDAININWSLSQIEFVIGLMGALVLIILLPLKPIRLIALVWLIIPFLPTRPLINQGEALIHVLDVGQGLAVHIQTQNHTLLYDTGDQFFQGSDLGKLVILPYYTVNHINTVDKIIISHPDKDHKGGLNSILESIGTQELIVNDPKYYKNQGLSCHHYPSWQWDGVEFRFFPIKKKFKDKNNSSCILQIKTGSTSALLTGDIELEAEDYLIRKYGEKLKSEILLLPHHGSKTSSSFRFLLEVSPLYAIASLGFDNRFHFPHAKTLNSLKTLGIPFYRTDECGMVEVKLSLQGGIEKPKCYSIDVDVHTHMKI